jgi:hypothetical protein
VLASVHRPHGAACLVERAGASAYEPIRCRETCLAANRSLSLGALLPRAAARLKAGDSLRIVAVGSSSTTGLWVLNPDATYPEVMRREVAPDRAHRNHQQRSHRRDDHGEHGQRDPDGSAVRAACSPPHNIQAIIAGVAREEHVGLFPRFALMRRSIDAGLPAGAPISWDGLHNSAAGYDCVGRALARAIHAGGR